MANWIAGATKNNKGVFKAAAQAHGETTRQYAQQHGGDAGTLGKRARLALTLMGMDHGEKHEKAAVDHAKRNG